MVKYRVLPGMTEAEVVRAAKHDKPALDRKMQRPMELLRRRHMKGDRKEVLEEAHPYEAPSGNRWWVVMRYSKAGIQVIHFVWYRGMDNWIRAARIRWDGGSAVHYSRHLLEQYGARFSPDVHAEERLEQFIRNNYDVALKAEELDTDNNNVLGGIRQGLLLGVYDEVQDVACMTTFVDHGHLFADQIALCETFDFERLLGSLSEGQRTLLRERRKKEEERGTA